MLALTPALLYALLFSSVPVLSTAIPPAQDSTIGETQSSASSTTQGPNVATIAVKIDSEDLKEVSSASCGSTQSACEEATTNRYGFQCGKKFFNQAQILSAAKAACPRISKNSQRHRFPAPYTATKYEKPGPYVQWPIKRNTHFWNMARTGKYRLVMTMDCAVVSAVIKDDDDDDDDDYGVNYRQCNYRRH